MTTERSVVSPFSWKSAPGNEGERPTVRGRQRGESGLDGTRAHGSPMERQPTMNELLYDICAWSSNKVATWDGPWLFGQKNPGWCTYFLREDGCPLVEELV
jgi:hypothetical protein